MGKAAAEILCVSIFTLLVTAGMSVALKFSPFQARDIERVRDLLGGHLIWHGPETSNDFNLPGPFYYYLLALPALVFKTWRGQWYLMMAMFAASEGILFRFLRKNVGLVAASVALYLSLSNRLLLLSAVAFWNPSYLPLFTVLIFIALARCFSEGHRRRDVIGFFLLMSFALQIHLIVTIYFLAFVLLFLAASRFEWPRPVGKDVALGLGVFSVLWVPFFIHEELHAYLSKGPDATGGTAHLLNVQADVVSHLKVIFYTLFVMPAPALWFLSLCALLGAIAPWAARAIRLSPKRRQLALVVFVVMAVSAIPAFSIRLFMDISPQLRYLVPFIFAAILFLAFWLQILCDHFEKFIYLIYAALCADAVYGMLGDGSYFEKSAAVCGLMLVLTCAVILTSRLKRRPLALQAVSVLAMAALILVSVDRESRPMVRREDNHINLWDMQFACETIFARTGWTFEQARYRAYFLNQHLTSIPKPMYDDIVTSKNSNAKPEPIDGFFIAKMDPSDIPIANESSFEQWLSTKDMERSVHEALLAGQLTLVPPFPRRHDMTVVPYKISDASAVPRLIHNSGEAYDYKPMARREGDQQPISRRWQGCDEFLAGCYLDISVAFDNSTHPAVTHISMHGPFTSAPKYTATFGSLGLQGLYSTVYCGGDKFAFDLADSVGYRHIHVKGRARPLDNNVLLTPIAWDLPTPCKTAVERVEVGWHKSFGLKYETTYSGPGDLLSFETQSHADRRGALDGADGQSVSAK